MSPHSIFARQWWSVTFRGRANSGSRGTVEQRIENFLEDLAAGVGGTLLKTASSAKPGLHISSISSEIPALRIARCLLQTDKSYFPIPEESLETGPIRAGETGEGDRDFPRRIFSGKNSIFQYPVLLGVSDVEKSGECFVLSSPYFLLLKNLIRSVGTRRVISSIAVDVEMVFKKLQSTNLENGTLTVRSGRMVINGIRNLRSAVFFGDNVIASPLYADLVSTTGVTVNPKDCRLQRSYAEPVGANRRPFVCWFDPHGNFRFTPGSDPISSVAKFIELLSILSSLKLVRDGESFNPLERIGGRVPLS